MGPKSLGSAGLYEDSSFTEADISRYKRDLAHFQAVRRIARLDAGDSIDYSAYEARIRKLIDNHVIGIRVEEPKESYQVTGAGPSSDQEEGWSAAKTRNEADLIQARIRRTIEEKLGDDPYAQKAFSALLKEAIDEANSMFDHPHDVLQLFRTLEHRLEQRDVPDRPSALKEEPHAAAYYGAFQLVLGDDFPTPLEDRSEYVDLARHIDSVVNHEVAQHLVNPANLEAAVRKALLPPLFKRVGMDRARMVLDQVIQIVRVGLAK